MELIRGEDIDFYYLTKPSDVKELIHIIQNEKLIAGDTEVYADYNRYGNHATWRDPHTSLIRLLQLNVPENYNPWVVDRMKIGDEGMMPLVEFLADESIRKVLHNGNYDLKQIRSSFGLWWKNVWCTKVMMQRLGLCTGFKSSQMRGHSLKSLARDFFDIILSKLEQSSDWSSPILEDGQLEYAALDVGAPRSSRHYSILLEGYALLLETLTTEIPHGFGVEYPLRIDQEANQVLAKIEYTGMPVNVEMLDALMDKARSELEDLKIKLSKELGFPAEQKLVFTNGVPRRVVVIPKEIGKLLNSPKELVKTINVKLQADLEAPLTDLQSSTLESLLKKLESEKQDEDQIEVSDDEDSDLEEEFIRESLSGVELISNLLSYKEKVKLVGTDYKKLINIVTGCMHSSYQAIGASTGRMSSGGNDSFNCQQISTVKIEIDEIDRPFHSESKLV